MARPKKTDSDKQTKHLPPVRCTEAEYAAILERAEQACLTLSEYIRKTSLEHKIVVKAGKADPELVFQLRKLAVNLNQQTRKFHQFNRVPPELDSLWTKLSGLLDKIILQEP